MANIDPDNVDIRVLDPSDYAFVIMVTMDGIVEMHGNIEREEVITALEGIVNAMKNER